MIDLIAIILTFVELNYPLILTAFSLGIASFMSRNLSDIAIISAVMIMMSALILHSAILPYIGIIFIALGIALKFIKL